MCAFAVVLYLVLIVSSSPRSPGRRVNHSLLRSITSPRVSPAQPIDFPPGSGQQWSNAVWVWRFGRELVEWRVTGEGFESLQIGIDRNQSLVTAARGLGELLNKMLLAGVNSLLHARVEPDLVVMGL